MENNKKSYAIVGVIVILILGLVGYNFYIKSNPDSPLAYNTNTAVVEQQNRTAPALKSESIDIQNVKPKDGVLKGVVEVGASGFNSFVVRMDKQNHWELVSKDFGESLAYEGLASVDDIQRGLKRYLAQMLNKGVTSNNLHFVISSGALKEPKTKDISAAISKMGYTVNEVTAEQEGKFAFYATLPEAYYNNGYVVDIGSGNTKISWIEGGSIKTVEASGAKYFQNNIKDEAVVSEIQRAVAQVPKTKQEYCFVIGGVPYSLAKQTRNGDERYTLLNAPDSYNAKDDVKVKSGLNIYKGLYNPNTKYVFDWDSNFTIGFLLRLK